MVKQQPKTEYDKARGVQFDLTPIFFPKSMVVIGVSLNNYLNPGTTIFLKNVFEMKLGTKTYGVNPNGGIFESQKVYCKVSDLPEVPDLAVLAINSLHTLDVIKECLDFGVKSFIVIGGGFAEIGKEGAIIQNKLADLCYDANTPLIGPNCVGIHHPPYVDTIFLPTEKLILPKKGNVSIVSQSGGILLDQFFLSFYERDIGVSSAVSIGNKAVINEVDMLKYYAKDAETQCISFYIEGFGTNEGRKFIETSTKIRKDIVIYQGGKSDAGRTAVASHTASLASNYNVAHAAFKQFGIIQPQNENEVLNYIKTYSVLSQSNRPINLKDAMKGNVAILTVSGGHGVVSVDLLQQYELELFKFNNQEIEKFKTLVNTTVANIGAFMNPIDLTGACSDDDIVKVLDELLNMDKIDIVICIVVPYPPLITIQIGRRIALSARHATKPLVCFVPYIEKYNLIREGLELYHIPVAHTVSETVQMAAAIRDKSRAILRLKSNRLTQEQINEYKTSYSSLEPSE
jgi:acyl-CoA synthetase (NDP forming)